MLAQATRQALRRCHANRVALGSRSFFNVATPASIAGPGGVAVTKYKIVKPGRDGVEWDGFLIALPEKDQLAKFSKEVPLFIRYLKVVTDTEGRAEDFSDFVARAKAGLTVESDVFVTTEELLAVMWKNGYSDQERNAIQFTFPSDYKFHYPELAVLFDLTEEDCYKFCMRTRIEASHIGELEYDKVKPQGFIRSHWLVFGVGVIIFKYFPFFNYYFGIKVFGTGMWCLTNWMLMNRMISKTVKRNEYMAQQKTAADVMEGENKILESMQLFANDARCVDYLKSFKDETEAKMAAYRKGIVEQMKEQLSERASKQLQAIASFEASSAGALQELVVVEANKAFKADFPNNKALQDKALSSAVTLLGGGEVASGDDPVLAHFSKAIGQLEGVDLATAKADASGSIVERVAAAQQAKEKEFKETFMVTKAEAAEVKGLASKAKAGADYDFSKLSEEEGKKLDALYTNINAKVGYFMPDKAVETTAPIGAVETDASADAYVQKVNAQLAETMAKLRTTRLKNFAEAFA
jgi:hypothetical protein